MLKFIVWIPMLSLLVVASNNSEAGTAHCWCKAYKLTQIVNDSIPSSTEVLKDYSSELDIAYNGAFPQSASNQDDCETKCKSKAEQVKATPTAAAFFCSMKKGNAITFGANVGTRSIKGVKQIYLNSTPPTYTCPQGGNLEGNNCKISVNPTMTCPTGWLSNSSGQSGGVSSDGICKKIIQGCTLTAPLPANNTFFGNNYGFTSGSSIAILGNSSNGGSAAPSCSAGFILSNNNCVKSYAATVSNPGVCQWQ